jgi:polyferredoxin
MTSSKTKSLNRLGFFLSTLFFGFVSYSTLTGELQSMIHFAGVLNEIGFFMASSTLTLIFATLTCID